MSMSRSLIVLAALALLASGMVSLSTAQPAGGDGARSTPPVDRPAVWQPGEPRHAGGPQAEQMEGMINMLRGMQRICFDPATSGMIAVGGIKDEVKRNPDDIIKDLEALLTTTKSLGLRNALHMTLKDLYKAKANDDKVLEHLRAMVVENDAALQANPPARSER